MKKELLSTFAGICAMAMLSGCSSDNSNTPSSPDENNERRPIVLSRGEQAANDDCTAFSLDLFADVMKNSDDDNAVVSPLSSFMVLGMIGNAVSDEARAEIVAAVGESMESIADVNSMCLTLMEQLPVADKRSELLMANAMWWYNIYGLPQAYATLLGDYYKAEVQTADFANSKTLGDINQWCARNTGNHITQIIEKLNPQYDFAVWLNALYFRGTWREAFEKSRTDKREFTLDDGSRIMTDMMVSSKPYASHYGTERFDAISIPYGNKSFYFTAIMPEEGIKLAEILDEITVDEWEKVKESTNTVFGFSLRMPKFSCSAKNDLIPYLENLGIDRIFNDESSFSTLGADRKIGLFNQKIEVKADEEGFTAAVVTAAKGMVTSPGPNPYHMEINRPFYYFVWESSTGAILLAGRLMQP